MKKEVFYLEKRHTQLTNFINDLYDLEAYQHLEETLINIIKNAIFEEYQFIPSIMMGMFEALKANPQKLKSFNEYCNRFLDKKLRPDNIDPRIDYLKSDQF